MHKKEFVIIGLAVIVVLGVILLPKYFQYRDSLEQEIVETSPIKNSLSENFSLPPPPATSTVIKTIILPKPLSPTRQQEVQKKITLPPPPAQ